MTSHQAVGREFPPFTYRVEEVKAREFARAIGDELRADPSGRFVAPLGMIFFVSVQDSDRFFEELGIRWDKALFGGSRFTYQRPLFTGDVLQGVTRVSGYSERGQDDGKMGFLVMTTEYRDHTGEPVMLEESTTVVRGGLA